MNNLPHHQRGFSPIFIIIGVVVGIIGIIALSGLSGGSWTQITVKHKDGSQDVYENGQQVGRLSRPDEEPPKPPQGFSWVE